MPDPEDNYKLRQALFSWGSRGIICENDVFAAMADLGGGGGWNEQGYELLAIVYSAILKKHGRLFCEQSAPCNLLSYNTLQLKAAEKLYMNVAYGLSVFLLCLFSNNVCFHKLSLNTCMSARLSFRTFAQG